MRYLVTLCAILLSFLPLSVHAAAYHNDDEVVGAVESHPVRAGESLIEIARSYDLGFCEIAAANLHLDPYVPKAGAEATIPTSWIVPREAMPGAIVVNLSEMRLYYRVVSEGAQFLVTFPIGIGDEGFETPPGTFRVVEKLVNPSWYVPQSVRKEKPDLPRVVPAGPDNPLGSHALRLSERSIMIHGTNKPWGVGRRASHGCIRLYPEDIPRLYRLVEVGTEVKVVREPVKVGIKGGRVYIEVHRDDALKIDYIKEANRLLDARGLEELVDPGKLYAAILGKRGVPVEITVEVPERKEGPEL